MDTKIFATDVYLGIIRETANKEKELVRLIRVKSEKLCNVFLTKECHTQLSYLPLSEQTGAIAVPKGMILDKLIAYLQSI